MKQLFILLSLLMLLIGCTPEAPKEELKDIILNCGPFPQLGGTDVVVEPGMNDAQLTEVIQTMVGPAAVYFDYTYGDSEDETDLSSPAGTHRVFNCVSTEMIAQCDYTKSSNVQCRSIPVEINDIINNKLCYDFIKDKTESTYEYNFEALVFDRMKCELRGHYAQFEGEGVTVTNEPFYMHYYGTGGPGPHGGHNMCFRVAGELVFAESASYRFEGNRTPGVAACKWI